MDKNIFSIPSMKHAHIFEFSNSPYKAQFYDESFKFSSGKKNIGIVDQFQGKRPIILNKEFVVEEKQLDLQLVQTLVLDSHIVDALHRYISGRGKIDDDTRQVTKDFLVHVSKLNCDYSPLFYLAENWAKSSREQFVKTSSEKLASILKLHSMDEEKFINDNVIVYKKEAVKHYCDVYSENDLDACGAAWAKRVADNNGFSQFTELSKLSYVCLLKMVLIHFINPEVKSKNILSKYFDFESFLVNELNLLLGRELNLALYYFSNFAGKFVNVQPNMSVEKALKNLRSTAWDLLLLRIPEFLLTPTNLPELNTAYVVTSEDKLLSIGDMFNIESIFYGNSNAQASPMLSFDLELFEKVLSKAEIDELNDHRSNVSVERLSRRDEHYISEQKLDWLIEDLEHQVGYLCA